MKFYTILSTILLIPLLSVEAQTHSGFSFDLSGSFSPELRFYDDNFGNSSAIHFRGSYFDRDYTRMEYSLQYARGFDSAVSYVAGLSASAVFQVTDKIRIKPGLGIQEFKMADRSCRTTWRTILDSIFDLDDQCSDDVHASFIGFTNLEYKLAEPFSFFLQMSYRTILSSVNKETGTELITGPNGESIERTNYATNHSFYGSGFGFSAGLRIYLWK